MNYKENKEYWASWYQQNKDRAKKQSRSWREQNPERYLHAQAKRRAKKTGLPFDIEVEDVVIPTHCPYMGTPLKLEHRGEGRSWTNPSLDRIDSEKGYVKGNVQVISGLANKMKNNATIEELICFAKGVLKHHDAQTTGA